jgi:CRP-like cAMP-binding protein
MKKEIVKSLQDGAEVSEEAVRAGGRDDGALSPPSGLGRTLSTELARRQAELQTLMEVNGLIESRTWSPGEVIIRKGSSDRDLFFVTKGVVEIWTEEELGCTILSEVEAPYILGDVAFLSGLPRTATARAKTEVRSFVLKYENFMSVFKGAPEWLSPLLSSFVSGIKSLHYKIAQLQDRI